MNKTNSKRTQLEMYEINFFKGILPAASEYKLLTLQIKDLSHQGYLTLQCLSAYKIAPNGQNFDPKIRRYKKIL